MLGHDHALSGALAFTAVAPLLHVTGVHLAVGAVLTAGAGVLPDLDEPGSTIARTFGFLTGAFAWIVHKISGGHRKGTHSLIGIAVLTAAALAAGSWQAGARATSAHPELWWHLVPAGLILALLFSAGFRALHIGGHHGDAAGIALAALVIWKGWDPVLVMSRHVPVLAVCVALGMLAHVAGDMCTHDGCPLLYPLSRHEFGLLPEPIRITTNKLAEHWVISPLLLAGLAYFLWRDSGFSLTSHGHLAGRLSRRYRPLFAYVTCGTWADWLSIPRHSFSAVFGAVIALGMDYRMHSSISALASVPMLSARRADAGQPEWFGDDDLYPDVRPARDHPPGRRDVPSSRQ